MTRSKFRFRDWPITIGSILVFLLIIGTLFWGCGAVVADEDTAINAARDAGYTDIEVIDKTTFLVQARGCGEEDVVRFTVRGRNPRGEIRTFYVCAGILKGGTIRSR